MQVVIEEYSGLQLGTYYVSWTEEWKAEFETLQ